MNKLDGFFELKSLSLPTVFWKEFRLGDKLSDDLLWTVRCAVVRGNDFNLPRLVGATADKAEEFANNLLGRLKGKGMVLRYPFFIADVSGTLLVSSSGTTIECVEGDLWNLVTYGRSDYCAEYAADGDIVNTVKEGSALSEKDISQLLSYAARLRANFRSDVAAGKSVYAEWSYAYNADKNGEKTGERYPVFYELRLI